MYYGDGTALKALLDCGDEVDWVALHDKFVTEFGDPRGPMGYPTDPDYVSDPTIRGRLAEVDCDKVKAVRVGGHHVSHTPVVHEPQVVTVNPLPTGPFEPAHIETPETEFQAPELRHVDSANELITPDPDKPVVEVKQVAGNHQGGHYNNANEYYQDHNDGSAAQASSDKIYRVRGSLGRD